MSELIAVAGQFAPKGRVIGVREFGSGNINKTFLVTVEGAREHQFILQRVNTRVFQRPELLMHNMRICTEHIRERLGRDFPGTGRRWEVPRVLPSRDGRDFWIDVDGSFWRAIGFIERSRTFDTINNIAHAEEVGRALGMFHSLLSDLPAGDLADTLEGFHVTPRYLIHFDDVRAKHEAPRSSEVDYCLRFVSERRARANVLEDARARGRLLDRPIHGDPKVNNILMDVDTGRAVGIVDLDTVKPGLVHYDIGDCLRSGCNPLGEETAQWEDVRFDLDLCRAILRGYLSMARGFLTGNDLEYIYDSIRLIAFELGLRFFTDYLEGNVYFRAGGPEHNLTRALVQFRLAGSIEAQEEAIRAIVRDAG